MVGTSKHFRAGCHPDECVPLQTPRVAVIRAGSGVGLRSSPSVGPKQGRGRTRRVAPPVRGTFRLTNMNYHPALCCVPDPSFDRRGAWLGILPPPDGRAVADPQPLLYQVDYGFCDLDRAPSWSPRVGTSAHRLRRCCLPHPRSARLPSSRPMCVPPQERMTRP